MGAMGQGVGSVINGIVGAQAADTASGQQVGWGLTGLNNLQNTYEQNSANYQPYIQSGASATNQLNQNAGPNGSLGRQFTQADFQQDPGYQFDLNQGLQAINNSASVRGGALSGGTLKALSNYGQEQANNAYQGAYNRFTQNQNQNFNQLSSIAGQGLSATQGLGQLGNAYGNAQMGQVNTIGGYQAQGTLGKALATENAVTGLTQAGTSAANQGSLGSLFGNM